MSARTFFGTAFGAALLLACSNPPVDDTAPGATAAPGSRSQELALTATPPAGGAVVSEIEVTRPGAAQDIASPSKTRASRRQPTRPAVSAPTPLPAVEEHVHETATPAPAAPELVDIPVIATTGPGPRVSEPDADGTAGPGRVPEPVDRWPNPGGRPGIIIRGGRDGLDPCDVHGGRGRPTHGGVPPVLVNPRMPTTGLPASPRGGGGIRF